MPRGGGGVGVGGSEGLPPCPLDLADGEADLSATDATPEDVVRLLLVAADALKESSPDSRARHEHRALFLRPIRAGVTARPLP